MSSRIYVRSDELFSAAAKQCFVIAVFMCLPLAFSSTVLSDEPLRVGNSVNGAHFSPDGARIVTFSKDRTVRVWKASSGQPITPPMAHDDDVYEACFSPDGTRVLTHCVDHTVRIWDAATGKPLGEVMRHAAPVNMAQFSPDGRRIITASGSFGVRNEEGVAQIWDAFTGVPVGSAFRHKFMVSCARFSLDGRHFLTVCDGEDENGDVNDEVRVWDAATGSLVVGPLSTLGETLSDARFSPSGSLIIAYNESGHNVWIWSSRTGRKVEQSFDHRLAIFDVQFSPNGSRMVVACGPQVIGTEERDTAAVPSEAIVWDMSTGAAVGALRHEDGLTAAKFSPDGKSIVTACWDRTARLWDSETLKPKGEPMRHEKPVQTAEFSPDSKSLITASFDDGARVWDAGTGKPLNVSGVSSTKPPLTVEDLSALLQSGMATSELEPVIAQRGYAGSATASELQALRKAGADVDLILIIKKKAGASGSGR